MPKPCGQRFIEQEILTRIIYARKKRRSYQKIADALNDDGIGRRRWSWQTVRNTFMKWQGKNA